MCRPWALFQGEPFDQAAFGLMSCSDKLKIFNMLEFLVQELLLC